MERWVHVLNQKCAWPYVIPHLSVVPNYCIQGWNWHALAWNAGPHVMCPWPCSVRPYFFTLLVPSMLLPEVPLPMLLSCAGKANHPPNQVPSHPTWPESVIFWRETSLNHFVIILYPAPNLYLNKNKNKNKNKKPKAGFLKLQAPPNLDTDQDIKLGLRFNHKGCRAAKETEYSSFIWTFLS